MNKKLIIMACSLVVLSGCANNTTTEVTTIETASDTSIETTVETKVETTETITSAEETTASEDTAIEEAVTVDLDDEVLEDIYESVEIINDDNETSFVDRQAESDYWTEQQIQEQLGTEYDLNNYTCVASFECGGAKLLAYVEDIENMPTSLVLYCKADKTMDILYTCKDMFTVRGYDSTRFADFQNFDNTVFAVESLVVGNCLPVYTWHLTEEGTIVDLADAIDFETRFPGLYTGGIETEDGYKTVIGLREQIPGTTSAGSSQLIPVTLENEVIVKLEMEPIID